MRLPYNWLRELVAVPDDVETVAAKLALRGFEVASIETGREPVIDFEITANRPDCLSVIGLAREASAAYGLPLRSPEPQMPPAAAPQPLEVTIEDAELCPRYCAQMFEVRPGAATPSWMAGRLEAAGVRSISAVVDVTNYVMLEIGQPTHAFDYAKLGGRALRIRRARAGETVRTLDGVQRTLESATLVIADAQHAQAVAGVMGGADSEIGAGTRVMVLESAYFKPSAIRRASKTLALKTEASTRFERGADIDAAPAAIVRAAALLQQIGAASPIGSIVDRYPAPRQPLTLTLRASRIAHVLGERIADAEIPARLEPLGFSVSPAVSQAPSGTRHPTTWSVGVPSFRVDVQREIDLIEEVARHDGYQGLPATFPSLAAPQPAPDPRTLRDRAVRRVLAACGFSEAMTFAFIEAEAASLFADEKEVVAVANPLSEKFAVLRPSLLPGLVDAAAHNRRREHHDIRLFEAGTRFTSRGERRAVAGVWSGSGASHHWSAAPRTVDFFDIKGVVETLAHSLGIEAVFEPATVSYLVEGRTARIGSIGLAGQVAPRVLEAREFPPRDALYAFEIDLDAVTALQSTDELRAEPLPRFPSVVRDMSLLLDDTLPAAAVRGTIRSAAPPTLERVVEFDRYRGKGVPDGRVSLSLRLTFRSAERTLTDAEVDEALQRIVDALAQAHGAVRR